MPSDPATDPSALRVLMPEHACSARLCPTCTVERFRALRPAPRARVAAEIVAARIRRDRGDVWGAVNAYGITYEHALRIRRGFRGAGRQAETIPYRSRGYFGTAEGSAKAGSTLFAQLLALDGDGPLSDALLDALALG